MSPEQLLERIAVTLRSEIGPAIGDEYPKTQAFLAAVVLEKLARQLGSADDHHERDRAEREVLFADLTTLLPEQGTPAIVRQALADAATSHADGELCRLLEALYQARTELGPDRFTTALSRIRQAMRAQIDRRVEVAR